MVDKDLRLPPSDWHLAPAALWQGLARLGRGALAREPLDAAFFKQAMVPFVHHLPAALRELLQRAWRRGEPPPAPVPTPPTPEEEAAARDYAARIEQENAIFADQVDVHALPKIYDYWSNRWLLPMELEFGARHPEDFLMRGLLEAARRTGAARPRFVSLGCGNCDAEVRIAQELVRNGLADFTLECIDINPAMLERGATLAREAGLEGKVVPVQGDFNRWKPQGRYDGVMANQSLHHVLELESLFDAVAACLHPRGLFAVSDMIGRNGHMRWPEALAIVREYWKELPESYRFNLQLQRQDNDFMDWDCSVEGFEGVRAQDILPLLVQRFGFETFLGFGNIIDSFIDRGFGHHFDADSEKDRAFIDRVHARDEAELMAGTITPTHMLATMTLDRNANCRYRGTLSPEFSVRPPPPADAA